MQILSKVSNNTFKKGEEYWIFFQHIIYSKTEKTKLYNDKNKYSCRDITMIITLTKSKI